MCALIVPGPTHEVIIRNKALLTQEAPIPTGRDLQGLQAVGINLGKGNTFVKSIQQNKASITFKTLCFCGI